MPRGGAHFSSQELARVLSHYDTGIIHEVKALSVGNRRVPKAVITSEQGKFVLKRRLRGRDDPYRVAFAHAVQSHLADQSFPIAPLVPTRDEDNTVLQLNNHIYEFFKFVTGVRYDGSAEATADAGRQLAAFHHHLADFASQWKPPKGSFHDSSTVRRHLKTVASDERTAPKKKMHATAEALLAFYNESSIRVNKLGFDSWPEQVVHGDWHPGNMLFSRRRVTAVLDFDSVKVAPAVTDLANGMLQFSIVGGRPNPADWPDYFDEAKLIHFLTGYREIAPLQRSELRCLLDLMIETMIAEAVLPIAATGFFGHLSGYDFLAMIQRKADWLNHHRKELTHAMTS
jgi:homoserine kinase type II